MHYKTTFKQIIRKSPISKYLSIPYKSKPICLGYHNISENNNEIKFNITLSSLTEQLNTIKEHRLLDQKREFDKIVDKFILITFDDGLESFYWAYDKVLSLFNTNVYLFVPTNLIDTPGYLTLKQCVELQNDGVKIYSHTHNHVAMKNNILFIEEEVKSSIKWLKTFLKQDDYLKHFAYPGGIYTKQTLDLMKRLGFEYCWTTDYGFIKLSERLQLKRILLEKEIDHNDFLSILRGETNGISGIWNFSKKVSEVFN